MHERRHQQQPISRARHDRPGSLLHLLADPTGLVCVDHTLGLAGGARSEQDAAIDRALDRCQRWPARGAIAIGIRQRIDGFEPQCVHRMGPRFQGHHFAKARQPGAPDQLFIGEAKAQRRLGHAGHLQGIRNPDGLDLVGNQAGNRLARCHTRCQQMRGQRLCAPMQLHERHRGALAIRHCDPITVSIGQGGEMSRPGNLHVAGPRARISRPSSARCGLPYPPADFRCCAGGAPAAAHSSPPAQRTRRLHAPSAGSRAAQRLRQRSRQARNT